MDNDARLTVRLPAELCIEVGREAEEEGRSASWVVRQALEERYWKRERAKAPPPGSPYVVQPFTKKGDDA